MSITAKNVCKRFGPKVVLDNVSVEAPSGKLVALLGPSGSGKTTLLRIIAGLEVPDSGSVHYLADDVPHHTARERNIGFVFQHYALFRHMTVFENVAFGLRVRKWADDRVRKRVAELLHLVRLDEYADRYPATLSGGQKQRIAVVPALAPEPPVRPVRRGEAAERVGRGPRSRAPGDAPGRAVRGPGRQGAERAAGLAPPVPRRVPRHQPVRHSRPGGGVRGRRQGGGNEPRPSGADRHAGGRIRPTGQRLRYGLPGQRERLPGA